MDIWWPAVFNNIEQCTDMTAVLCWSMFSSCLISILKKEAAHNEAFVRKRLHWCGFNALFHQPKEKPSCVTTVQQLQLMSASMNGNDDVTLVDSLLLICFVVFFFSVRYFIVLSLCLLWTQNMALGLTDQQSIVQRQSEIFLSYPKIICNQNIKLANQNKQT